MPGGRKEKWGSRGGEISSLSPVLERKSEEKRGSATNTRNWKKFVGGSETGWSRRECAVVGGPGEEQRRTPTQTNKGGRLVGGREERGHHPKKDLPCANKHGGGSRSIGCDSIHDQRKGEWRKTSGLEKFPRVPH